MTAEAHSSFDALFKLLRYARGFRARIVAATSCSILNKLFDVMPEILIGVAIDVIVRQEDSIIAEFGIAAPTTQILVLGAITFAIWVFESVFEYLHLLLWRNLAQDLQQCMRIDAYEHVQNFDVAYFEDRSTGSLVAILNDDVNQLERFLNGGANNLIQVATTVVAVGAVFFVLSPLIALIAFTPIPVVIVGAFWFQRRAMPLYAAVREHVGLLASRLSANISGIATIKRFATEALEAKRLRADSEAYVVANRKAILVSSAFIPVIRMAILAGFLATFLIGGYMALNGSLQMLPAEPDKPRREVAESSGFSLHAGIVAQASQRDKLEHLARYVARPPVAVERIALTDRGQVRYTLKTPYRDGTTHVIFEPEDFIARLAALVPKPRAHQTRYHGVFAPVSPDRPRVVPGARAGPTREARACSEPSGAERKKSLTWAQRLKRVFAIDIEVCRRCGGTLRVIASIEDPPVIERILDHLGHDTGAIDPAHPSRAPPGDDRLF